MKSHDSFEQELAESNIHSLAIFLNANENKIEIYLTLSSANSNDCSEISFFQVIFSARNRNGI